MKKIFMMCLSVVMILGLLAGCGRAATTSSAPSQGEVGQDDTTVRVAALKGPTAMGLVKLLADDAAAASPRYDFTMAATADEITPKLVKGELDLAAVPVNLASVLYNKTNGGISLLAVNTLGVLSILETGEAVQSIADLKGKTLYATGKGSTPEYNLRYLLMKNGINPDKDVTVEWKSEATEIVAALKTKGGIAMLPQPYATAAKTQISTLRTAIDLNAEWEKLGESGKMITGVMVARREFVQAHPSLAADFLKQYADSIGYVGQNTADAAALIGKYDIVKAPIAEKALPFCNITYFDGKDMKAAVGGYLGVLFDLAPASVGGKLPPDDFYYEK